MIRFGELFPEYLAALRLHVEIVCAWLGELSYEGSWPTIVALAQGARERVVLFDELSRVSRDNKRKIVERMLDWTGRGIVTQFLGNDLDEEDYRNTHRTIGAKIIEVGGVV